MKIKNFTSKTSLEVSSSDLLIIEDTEDTKSITVSELLKYIESSTTTKKLINETLDNIITSLQTAKYNLIVTETYNIEAEIKDASNNLYITLKKDDIALTSDEISSMLNNNGTVNPLKAMLFIDDIYINNISYTLDDNGVICFTFDSLTNNQLYSVSKEDIVISLGNTDTTEYVFIVSSLENALSYEETEGES